MFKKHQEKIENAIKNSNFNKKTGNFKKKSQSEGLNSIYIHVEEDENIVKEAHSKTIYYEYSSGKIIIILDIV